MLFTKQDFFDAIAFERSVLDAVLPAVGLISSNAGLDLRTNIAFINVTPAVIGENRREELLQQFRPLLFGAAWKVLDLLIEYGLHQNQPNKDRWLISEKQQNASQAQVVPLTNDAPIWNRIASVYVNTVEQRHCLVHRSFDVVADGTMTGMRDKHKKILKDITPGEQAAFCRLIQQVIAVFQTNLFGQRQRMGIIFSLDELNNHHGLGVIGGGGQLATPLRIKINTTRQGEFWEINTIAVLERVKQAYPKIAFFDIEIFFPDSGIPPLLGRLDEAPQDVNVIIDPANPPEWVYP